ncbi:MAG: CBS domain-containing protein [bacterium]|nr:CBS domain-containing protein [bacterium]
MEQSQGIGRVQELTYELKVEEVMTRNVVTVSPDNRVSDLRELFRVNRISGTPVVDAGRLVGIISIEDFIKCLANGEMDCRVRDRMTSKVEVLYAGEPVVHAINRFQVSGYGRFPVLDRESGRLIGILSKGDIIRALLKKLEIDYQEEEIHRYRASHIFEDTVADRTSLTLEYDIKGKDFDNAGKASSSLKRTLSRLGFHPQLVRRVAIASYEAEMNIVVFTDQGRISAIVQTDGIVLRAADRGPGIPDIELAMQPGYSTAPEWVRELGFGAGMGLCNIKKSADEMELRSEVGKGTDLRVTFHLKKGGP